MSESSGSQVKKKYTRTAEDIVFYTDTDAESYPVTYTIYIASDGEVWMKKKPPSVALTLYTTIRRRANFKFDSDEEFKSNIQEDLDERVAEAVKTSMEFGNVDRFAQLYDIDYETYAGDYERLIGTFKATVVKVIVESKFRCWDKQAWAISFEWEKRIKARHPGLVKYTYAKANIGRRNYARVIMKIPFAPKELDEVLAKALASASIATQTSIVSDLEEHVKKLEELIKQKEAELQALREQLAQLQLKLQLERMKMKMVE
ncbi:MAG: hypothetical protein QXT64_03350 [Desulfurococcaceae archaeon]